MRTPTPWHWWSIVVAALAIVVMWPPVDGKSLGMTVVNWAVDPWGELPILPPPLGRGASDDVEAVEAHDAEVRRFDEFNMKGGWTRRRLLLKVANDPFDKSITRQLLSGLAVLSALVFWRVAGRSRGQ